MTLKEALTRIAELERRIAALEAAPREQHTHYHTAPIYAPNPMTPPANPLCPPWTVPYGGG